MTPDARVATAIECLDRICAGSPAERVLTGWARGARHAGSKDRAAIRDLVYEVLRRWWSTAERGGGETGRSRLLGLARDLGADPADWFTGQGYGPPPLSQAERDSGRVPDGPAALDCPAWLAADLADSLDSSFVPVMQAMRHRAPVHLRANLRRTDPRTLIRRLADAGIVAHPHPLSPAAIEIAEGGRALRGSGIVAEGFAEPQDAASQAVADMVPLDGATRVLDYCAGGGGKTLAMAARHDATWHVHDAVPRRMSDLPDRAARAGVGVELRQPGTLGAETFDVVLVDAPCSGSGAWRRDPEGKIRLDRDTLSDTLRLQSKILDDAARHVAAGGCLVYATCSLLRAENADQIRAFAARDGWRVERDRSLTPLDGGDGFYTAILSRPPATP